MPDDNSFEMLYDNLRAQETISFWSTSFIRGVTLDNAIVIVDEFSNLNFHELDSMITRIGEDSKIMFCGDITQTDLTRENDRSGISDFIKILQEMKVSLHVSSLISMISFALVLLNLISLVNTILDFNV